VMGGDAKPGKRAATGVPWLGLLLWMFACAALFVSLIIRDDDLDGDRRVAARTEAEAQSSGLSDPVRRWTHQASELSVFTARRPPSR
jgi:hypothetical protein